MAPRLLVVAHGRVGGAVDPVFGDPGPLTTDAAIGPLPGRVQRWVAGPEEACRQTARLLGGDPVVMPGLAGPAPGRWRGRTVTEVAAQDPAGLRAWLTDARYLPPGGESMTQAMSRVGAVIDGETWPDGRSVVVVTPVVARLLAIHAVGGTPELGFRLDVRFGGRFELSGGGRGWRLLLG